MKITVTSSKIDSVVEVHLSDERLSLANFLSILTSESIDKLEISDFKDAKFPKSLKRFDNLKSLLLRRCHALSDLSSIRCLNIQELAILKCADFHDLSGISEFENLKTLHVSGCDAFDFIPDEISKMKTLQAIDFSYNTALAWINLSNLPPNIKILDMHGCWRADFDDADAANLQIVSLQIQDLAHASELSSWTVIPNLITQLRHSMTMRDGCSLDS